MGLRVCIARKLPGAAPLLVQGPHVAGSVGEQSLSAQAPLRLFLGCLRLLFCPPCHDGRAAGFQLFPILTLIPLGSTV